MRNRQLISSYVVVDPESGEQIRGLERTIKFPETVSFRKDFCKIHHVVHRSMKNVYIGKFIKLTEHLEWDTNRLVDQGVGRNPIPLDQSDISLILGENIRSTNTFMVEMQKISAIMKIEGAYYMNPRFASHSKYIITEHIEEMINRDPLILNAVADEQRKKLKYFL